MREGCERSNKVCENGPRGAVCVHKPKPKTGNEKIGVGTCTVNHKTYSKSQLTAPMEQVMLLPLDDCRQRAGGVLV